MNTENTFLRYVDSDNDNHYISINQILTIGDPWDSVNNEPMTLADNKFYQYVNTDRGWCFQPI